MLRRRDREERPRDLLAIGLLVIGRLVIGRLVIGRLVIGLLQHSTKRPARPKFGLALFLPGAIRDRVG